MRMKSSVAEPSCCDWIAQCRRDSTGFRSSAVSCIRCAARGTNELKAPGLLQLHRPAIRGGADQQRARRGGRSSNGMLLAMRRRTSF